MKAVLLTFDRLPTWALGCYGNEAADTPQFDRLAAESLLFDFHFCEQADPDAAGHAWWSGRHHFPFPADVQRSFSPVTSALAAAGVRTILLTEAGASPPAPGFAEQIEVSGQDGLDADGDNTPFARLIAAAEQQLERLEPENGPWLLWLRSRGVPRPWLPPRSFALEALARAGFLDDDADSTTPEAGGDQAELDADLEAVIAGLIERLSRPERLRDEIRDTGEFNVMVQTARAVYAGYVTHLDWGLGRLRETLESRCGAGRLLFAVTAALGESLGETLLLGERRSEAECGGRLSGPVIQTPLLLQVRPGAPPGRSPALVQTTDLAPTLLEWFGGRVDPSACHGRSLLSLVRGEGPASLGREPVDQTLTTRSGGPPREFVCIGDGAGQRAIRTGDLLLVTGDATTAAAESAFPPRLYIQPEDRWQVNDVAAQSPAEADRLEGLLREYVASRTVPPL